MHVPKLLKPFLTLTAHEKTPTDFELDRDIEYVSSMMHYIWPLLASIIRNKIKRFFKYRWKYLLRRILIICIFIFVSYIAYFKVFNLPVIYVDSSKKSEPKDVVLSYPSDSSMNLENFLTQIAYVESRNTKGAKRDGSQYWGLYALGTDARREAGCENVPEEVFMKYTDIQHASMIRFLVSHKKQLQKYIDKYSGKVIDGVLVTESGILAMSHLGCGAAKSYLDSGVIPNTDKNGNPVRSYLKLGGYNLQLNNHKIFF